MEWHGRLYKKLELLDQAIVKCRKCPRLLEWREEVAVTKRKSYADEKYWGKPVPGFGPSNARIIILGLAPGAHGANRTGRVFTGDSSGDWLYRALHKQGLAKISTSDSRDDGQELIDTRILCAVRCAPPDNKPSTEEKELCSDFFSNEILLLLPTAESFIALGSLAWDSIYRTLKDLGCAIPSPKPKFGHGVSYTFTGIDGNARKVVGSYHPSQQNTFTGKLTEKMLDAVIRTAKKGPH
jgi:uracil-DNA glycosylase family 4